MNTNILISMIICPSSSSSPSSSPSSSSSPSQMRYEAFGQNPVEYGVMDPTGEKFSFKTMSVILMVKRAIIC